MQMTCHNEFFFVKTDHHQPLLFQGEYKLMKKMNTYR